jgi:hypothetical protein
MGHHARHADQRRVLRHQRRDAGAKALDALGELRVAQRMGQFIEQHRASEKLDLTVDAAWLQGLQPSTRSRHSLRADASPWAYVPRTPWDSWVRSSGAPGRSRPPLNTERSLGASAVAASLTPKHAGSGSIRTCETTIAVTLGAQSFQQRRARSSCLWCGPRAHGIVGA